MISIQELALKIQELHDGIRWLDQVTEGCVSPESSKRAVLGLCLMRHTNQLAGSILVLLSEDRPNAAFALARSLLEAYVRAIWVLECAQTEQVEKIYKDKLKFPPIREAIEKIESEHAIWINEAKKKLDALHDFCHGGIQTCTRQFDGTNIRPEYPNAHRLDLLETFVKPILFGNGLELLDRLGIAQLNTMQVFARVIKQEFDVPIEKIGGVGDA